MLRRAPLALLLVAGLVACATEQPAGVEQGASWGWSLRTSESRGRRPSAKGCQVPAQQRVAAAAAGLRLLLPGSSAFLCSLLEFFVCPAAAQDRELLLSFKAGITNWEEVQAAWGLVGWTECTARDCTPVCSWTGIECDPYHVPNNHVTGL